MKKEFVEAQLKLLPEVTWDRWMGELDAELGIGVFGWLSRPDGLRDFVYLRLDKDGVWLFATSSAKYSADFAARLKFEHHGVCKRVAEHFSLSVPEPDPNKESVWAYYQRTGKMP